MDFDQPAGITWEQTVGAVQIAIDSIRAGDIDEVEVERTWAEGDTEEGFRLVLRRDTIGRHEAEKVDAALRELGER